MLEDLLFYKDNRDTPQFFFLEENHHEKYLHKAREIIYMTWYFFFFFFFCVCVCVFFKFSKASSKGTYVCWT